MSVNYSPHSATEYWQFQDPTIDDATPHATVRKCAGGEDTECSNSFGEPCFPPSTFHFVLVLPLFRVGFLF